MSNERTTWSLSNEAAEALEAAADRKEHESASQFAFRVAELLDATDDGTDVTICDMPDNSLTEDHIVDIATMTARRTADEVETRFR